MKRTQGQLLHAEKMVSLGRLVAGVAHELNNPISFVLGNVLSLKRYAGRLESYLGAVHASAAVEDAAPCRAMRQELRIDRILADMPHLIDGMIEGAERTRDIVDALKRFSAVDQGDAGAGQPERGRRAFRALGGAKRFGQILGRYRPANRTWCVPARPASCSRWS